MGTILNAGTVRDPLTAEFEEVPASHNGTDAIVVQLKFSEDIVTSYKVLRDTAVTVAGGTVQTVKRVSNRNDLWKAHVKPSGNRDMTLSNGPSPSDRTVKDAVCTSNDVHLSEQATATVPGPEDPPGTPVGWKITVEPGSATSTVTFTLLETTDCDASGAICTEDDRPLSNSPTDEVAATAGYIANGDELDEALVLAGGLTPDQAAAALFGEQSLSEDQLDALDRLGNRSDRYDLGSSRHPRPHDSGQSRHSPARGTRRRARRTGFAAAMLLAAALSWSCSDRGVVGPAASAPDPGFLTVELAAPATNRDIGVLLEVAGEDYELRNLGQYQAVITN